MSDTDHWNEDDWRYFNGEPSASKGYEDRKEQILDPEDVQEYFESICKADEKHRQITEGIVDRE